jgi:hypothetical protein
MPSTAIQAHEYIVDMILRIFNETESKPDVGLTAWWTQLFSTIIKEGQEQFEVKLSKIMIVRILIARNRVGCNKGRKKDLEALF